MVRDERPIGILGDGQLALMIGEAAESRGIPFLVLGSSRESSAARRFPDHFVLAAPTDPDMIIDFAKRCRALTLENEFFGADFLREVESRSGTPVFPALATYAHFDSKRAQRAFFDSLGLPQPRWKIADGKTFERPVVLKASRGGYDGYGVRFARTEREWREGLRELGFPVREVLEEEWIAIRSELARGALFDGRGGYVALPLVETVQKSGTCAWAFAPPRLDSAEVERLERETRKILAELAAKGASGLLCFEFFFTETGELLLNEGAPRPHNSQHLTLSGCDRSQFDLLVDYLGAGNLGSEPTLRHPTLMVNVLGREVGAVVGIADVRLPSSLRAEPKFYLKRESKPGRKLGHVNIVDDSGSADLGALGARLFEEIRMSNRGERE